MKKILTFLFSIINSLFLAQNEISSDIYLTFNNKEILPGDFIEPQNFKLIKVEDSKSEKEYYLRFIVVSFKKGILNFSSKESEIPSLDFVEMLKYKNLSVDDIKHVILELSTGEEGTSVIYNTHVFTRNLISAEDYYNEFVSYVEANDLESSILLIDQATILDSNNLHYQNLKAKTCYDLGKWELAKNSYLKLSELNPNFESFSKLARITVSEGDGLNSKLFAEKALKLASNKEEKADAYLLLGDAENKMFNYQEAYIKYKKSLQLNPNNILTLNNITTILDEVNKADDKVIYFKRILEIDSSFYLVHVNIGYHYLDKKEYAQALNEFNAVLDIDPNQPLALSNKSFAQMKLGQLESALETINKSIKLMPSNSYAYRNKGLILLEMKENDKACKVLQEAINLNYTQQYGNEVIQLLEKNCQ